MTDPETTEPARIPSWWVYRGDGAPRSGIRIPDPPPWRDFGGVTTSQPQMPPGDDAFAQAADEMEPVSLADRATDGHKAWRERLAAAYRALPKEARLVNTAIYLRRPMLVTGLPGTGKSTLAYSIARELDLGPVLRWNITSRTTLKDGLYQYDAIGRLQDLNIAERRRQPGKRPARQVPKSGTKLLAGAPSVHSDMGSYIKLGPLGTAMVPGARPRVLLIDEIDKGDIDLPNDLLAIFEEGEFAIPEVERLPAGYPEVAVMTQDSGARAATDRGWIRCAQFPIVVMTSNSEREFPPAFLRRCIRMDIKPPRPAQLERVLRAHFDGTGTPSDAILVKRFLDAHEAGQLIATDQLLNALQINSTVLSEDDPGWPEVIDAILRPLNEQD